MNHVATPRASFAPSLPATLIILLLFITGGLFSAATGGRSDVGLTDLWHPTGLARDVVFEIRLPRMGAAACLGINLGLAGLALQALTRNPLASPAILGINQGAAFGVTLSLILPGVLPFSIEVTATLGALMAGLLTFAISGGFSGKMEPTRLILGGIAVGALSFALVRFAFTLEDELARSVVRWTVGDISDIRWRETSKLACFAGVGFAATMLMATKFNIMALGQDSAKGLGLDPRLTLFLGAGLAAGLTGVSVAAAGPIAFAGLVVPHLARPLAGHDHRLLIPVTALLGASLLMIADGLSKTLTAPIETPIGVVAALLGAPFFLWQTLRSKDLL